MLNEKIIADTTAFVRSTLAGDASGHDWWHIFRVWRTAKRIGQVEGANLLVVELSALLHDIADWKSHGGDFSVGPRKAQEWLARFDLDPESIAHICFNIEHVSFKGATVKYPEMSLEGQVVQDADRLDAMGAIGIARTFAYGGTKGRAIYDPEIKPLEHTSVESYVHNESPSINHFYEKLLVLKNMMNTDCGRQLAEDRHRFMEDYLEHFYDEWEGRR